MNTKNITPGRETQLVTPFGTSPIPAPPSLKQTSYDGTLLKERYMIEGELGRGGIGVVYLARDTQLMNRRVVVKVLLEDSGNSLHSPWFKKKFEQEIEALVRLDHPGIVGVLDAGTMPDGKQFFVMQYVEGRPLRSMVNDGMSFAQIARVIRQIGYALTSAHDKGIVHRDLKPENIMVQQVGEDEEMIKLIDFGIATVKDSQVATSAEKTKVAGALPYMAPEQLRGQPDASSDIWALGAMAYEMLTGRIPFYAETLVQLYELQKRGLPVQPGVLCKELPPAAETAIIKSLAFDPAERYRRAKDFGDELARALTGETITTSSASAANPTPVHAARSESPVTSESPGYGTVMTHSAKTQVGQDHKADSAAQQKSPIGKYLAIAAGVAAIAIVVWLMIPKTDTNQQNQQLSNNTLPAIPSRSLNYSLLVRLNPEKNPGKQPMAFAGEIVFSPGDQLRLTFNSPQEGYLYIVNEGPEPQNGLPAYNILFPNPALIPNDVPSLRADKPLFIPANQDQWFTIDKEEGTETLWLIWSEKSISELESAKKWLVPQYGGAIGDPAEILAIQQFLTKNSSTAKPVATKGEIQTSLKGGKDGFLIYPIRLAHT